MCKQIKNRYLRLFVAIIINVVSVSNAESLRIGVSSEISGLDPHERVYGPNLALARHIYDPLIIQDNYQVLKPGLATAWRQIDPLTVELDIRQGVKFHDGFPLTLEDIIYSLNRSKEDSATYRAFTAYTKHIVKTEIPGPHTLRLITDRPYALLLRDLSNVAIMRKSLVNGKTPEELNLSANVVGTGPYKFQEWKRGEKLVLNRNTSYWGEVEPWEQVTFIPITSNPSRTAALLTGAVDMIESVPIADIERLRTISRLNHDCPSRVFYLSVDSDRAVTPDIKGSKGEKNYPNPLKDVRVRQAISCAINRPEIIKQLLGGQGIPAGQLVYKPALGYVEGLSADAFNPELARKLMQDSGHKDGFKLILRGPVGRYPNDTKILQAIASMLNRIGIQAMAVSMPPPLFFTKSANLEFSVALSGWPLNKEAAVLLKSLLHTFDGKAGYGALNRGRYSSIELDKLIEQSLETFDEKTRGEIVSRAVTMAMKDYALIPLLFHTNIWATKPYLKYETRMDEFTLAMGVRKVRS